MKNEKINLFATANRFVYIVARKLRKGDVIVMPRNGADAEGRKLRLGLR